MDAHTKNFLLGFKNSIRCFTPALRQAYLKVLADFRNNPETAHFETVSTPDGFEDPTSVGVAHRMYWWFPTHFFKFQDALFRWEENCTQKDQLFLLNRHQITFLDLGCGAGAASAAILSVIEQYQDYLATLSQRTDLITVNFIGVDPFQPELDSYKIFIEEYASNLKTKKISANIKTICQPFPEAIDDILAQLSLHKGHVLIVGMSNLINWIWNEADPYLKERKHESLQKLESLEIEALKRIAAESNFDISYVVGVATKDRKRWWLAEKLAMLLEKLIQVLSFGNRTFSSFWKTDAEVLFENPEGSRRSKDKANASSRFFVETITDLSPQFANDNRYKNLWSPESLERAWVKAQTWINYEAFIDRVELKLFEIEYQSELKKLKTACLEKFYEYLNIGFDFPYEFPKNEKVNRPKSLARLEEQITSVALAIEFGYEIIGDIRDVSFSFQMARKDSEFMYRYWFELYSRYIDSVLKNAGTDKILTTDLKSFYMNINQKRLLEILAQRLTSSNLSYDLIFRIIDRDCHASHDVGYGILQGHSVSGLLANLFLQPVDRKFLTAHGMRGNFFRFTDDVTITRVASNAQPLETEEINNFRNLLLEHDAKVVINEGKTKIYGDHTEFENKVRSHKDMDGVSARFNKLLLPMFVMNNSYRREFNKSSLHFVYEYNELLERLGLHVSPEWLFRKLDEYTNQPKLLRGWYKILRGGYSVKFPTLPANASFQSRLEWAKEFEKLNPGWMAEKENVKQVLAAMFNNSAMILMNLAEQEDLDTSRAARKIKFSLNRLSIFGGGDTANQTSWMLINRPWDMNVWLACKNLGRSKLENELSHVIDHAKMSYVRALALKALGTIRTPSATAKILEVLDNGNERIERLMASEALLEINLWKDVSYERIMKWMEKDCGEPYLHKNIILILVLC